MLLSAVWWMTHFWKGENLETVFAYRVRLVSYVFFLPSFFSPAGGSTLPKMSGSACQFPGNKTNMSICVPSNLASRTFNILVSQNSVRLRGPTIRAWQALERARQQQASPASPFTSTTGAWRLSWVASDPTENWFGLNLKHKHCRCGYSVSLLCGGTFSYAEEYQSVLTELLTWQ